MMMEKVLARSLRLMFASGVAATFGLAAQSAMADEAVVQRVEITGSSIKRIALEGALPVLSISQEEIKKSGATSVTELIQALPSMQGFTNSSQSVNGGTGVQTASIHNIGEGYTLVLLNGRRMASFGAGSAVNLGSIPLAAIERVEVLTDGASALYGSDAIAGVVNFITKKNVRDLTIEANANAPQHTGGQSQSLSITKGFGDLDKDGYNAMFAFSHDEQKELNAEDRPFANTGMRKFSDSGKDYYLYQLAVNTAPASATLRFKDAIKGQSALTFSPNYMKDGKCGANTYVVVDAANASSCWYDFGATVQLVPKTKRDSFVASFNQKLGDHATLFAEAVATQFEMTARWAPPAQGLAMDLSSPLYTKYVTPYLTSLGVDPANVKSAKMNLRLTDAGGRTDRFVANSTHLVAGVGGDFMDWDYNASLTRSQNKGDKYFDGGYLGKDAYSAIQAAGTFDPFAPSGASTAILAPAVLHTNRYSNKSTLDIGSLRGSREVFKLDGGSAQLGLGADLTKQTFSQIPSAIEQGPNAQQPNFTNTAIGFGPGGVPVDSSQKSWGAFAELFTPITKQFDVTTSARYDSYKAIDSAINYDIDGNLVGAKTLGNANNKFTYKLAASYRPTSSVLLRASYGTGFKAPTMDNIVNPPTSGGVTSGKYNCPVPSSSPLAGGCNGNTQYATINGGNPTSGDAGLKPEQSKQGTIGIRIEPVASVSLGFDFWDVKMRDQISTLPEEMLFGNAAAYQGLFKLIYDSTAGENVLAGTVAPFNLATSHYQGIDWDHSFKTNTEFGKLNLNWTGTWTHTSESDVPGVGVTKSVGRFDEYNNVALRWQTRLIASLTQSAMFSHTLALNWHSGYHDQVITADDGTVHAANPDGSIGAPTDLARDVKGLFTADWQSRVTMNKDLVLTAGVRNLFGAEPPFSVRTQGGGNQVGYDGRYSDPYGRVFYVKASYKFQ